MTPATAVPAVTLTTTIQELPLTNSGNKIITAFKMKKPVQKT
jgi:hypothetical protein